MLGQVCAGPKADIVDTAVGAGSFKTLVAAVKAAGLVDTLKGKWLQACKQSLQKEDGQRSPSKRQRREGFGPDAAAGGC